MSRTSFLSSVSIIIACLGAAPAVAQIFEGDAVLLSQRPAEVRPALMVMGSGHLANNNRDVVNIQHRDILGPDRQAQIEEVVAALAAWRPTRIAVEVESGDQAELDQRYADYRAGRLELTANEIDQFGLRLAARLGHDRLYAVDWNDMPPGEIADYDWNSQPYAGDNLARFRALRSPDRARDAQQMVDAMAIRDWLAAINAPDYLLRQHRVYHDYALLGLEGANWVGAWHGRNLKIFANITRLAASPDERVLVIYGSGHAFLLNRFASESGAFAVQDASDWLSQENPGPH